MQTSEVSRAMHERVNKGELSGMVTVIAKGDEVAAEAIGNLSFGDSAPMRRDTIFRIASLTKPITAVAVMMLVEDGIVDLHEPVERWLPELAHRRVLRKVNGTLDDTEAADRPITTEDLLTFRMGFGIMTEPEFDPSYPINVAAKKLWLTLAQPDPRTPHDPGEWMKRFGTLPLMDQPGTKWRYNAGSMVLGVLIARAAKMPFEDFLRQRIFEPLGMADTGFWLHGSDPARIPQYYVNQELQPLSRPEEWTMPPAFPSGAGGLLSTVDDYLKFAQALMNKNPLFGTESLALMTSNHLTPEQIAGGGMLLNGEGWGYGVSVSPTGRYGWAGGYGTIWFNDPAKDLIAMAFTQNSSFLFMGGAQEFATLAECV